MYKKLLPKSFVALAILLVFSNKSIDAQNIAINSTGTAAVTSAILDVSSTTSGLLVPRMTAAQRALIGTPATSLLVYQTDAGTTGAGFYFYNGTAWSPFGTNNGGWGLIGNTGTVAATNYLGTTDAIDLVFRTTATERMRILSGGRVGIGIAAPLYKLHVIDAVGAATPVGYFDNSTAAGYGLIGINSAASGASTGSGIQGLTNQSGAAACGLYGKSTHATGCGLVATGNNVAPSGLFGGQGAAITGLTDGATIWNTSLGVSEAIYSSNGGSICRYNYWSGTTQYKAISTGAMSVSCSVPDANGDYRVLHCTETPEFYFADYGEGELVNGRAHINIDSILAANVTINSQHPLRVYIQIEDDENCRGVVVKNKTAYGFDVVEMMQGSSNAKFQWNIVCNVADATLPSGKKAKFEDIRFEHAPKDAAAWQIEH